MKVTASLRLLACAATAAVLLLSTPVEGRQGGGSAPRKHVLAWADVRNGYQHDSIDLSAEQRSDLLSFVRDDGKGFVAAHAAITAFFSWPEFGEMIRVLAHLDPSMLDLTRPLVHQKDGDFPAAWAKTYGKGRVFYSILGHADEDWDNPVVAKMYFEAIRWALGLVAGDATPSSSRPPR